MARYIDADKCDEIIKNELGVYDTTDLKEMLSYFPTEDVQEVKHGKWIQYSYNERIYHCSKCSRCVEVYFSDPYKTYPYCNCGAKMEDEK